MANYVNITLDTTAPANPTIVLESGGTYAAAQLVTATIGTSDGSTVGYQMKIWGDVDPTYDTNIKALEAESSWITLVTSKQVKVTGTDGTKTVYVKIRDDVYNESAQASDSVILDLSAPMVTVSAPDVSRISKISGKNVSSFTFSTDSEFVEYKVKVVGTSGALENTGTVIPTTAGSSNTSGTGTFAPSTPISVQINGADLETANSGDGAKIIKVFVKAASGIWSV